MKAAILDQLKELQRQPSQIRNICILAHVDHGKTTIADALVASNGIISKRNAGKIRYMDSRADEQERGITMKSSAITLMYEKQRGNEEAALTQYLINLIDSPGHVDFSSEVTTAVRLCDGAVVVVDVVEGVCPQTQAVLKQAWLEGIRPILVLNKLDRLISHLKMTPIEAYYRLIQILEQVNLITNQLFTSEAMEKTSLETNKEGLGDTQTGESNSYDWTVIEDEEEHKNIYFSPELGNVIFASAIDGWGFTMGDFARMYAAKLGVREHILHKTLWGDYYMNMKAKRFMKGAQSKGKKPLFVQFALDNIWAVYDAVLEKRNTATTEKIVKSLDLTLATKDLHHKDSRLLLQSIMGQWLPLSDAVLDTVTTHIPSPLEMSEERVQKLMASNSQQFSSLPEATQHLKKDFQACSSQADTPVIIFVSKMFPMEKQCLPRNKSRPLTDEELQQRRAEARKRNAEILAKRENSITAKDNNSKVTKTDSQHSNGHTYVEATTTSTDNDDTDDHVFIAFARIFSGTVRKGSHVFFLGPKHVPEEVLSELSSQKPEELHSNSAFLASHPHITSVKINDLYLLMGRELEALEEIPAGNVLGIGGLEGVVVKSGTLTSTLACPAFSDMYFDAAAIVRVAVEPVNASDMNKLVAGLRLLNQADPCVEVRVQETGEHVIIAAGEVHLQKCIDDLKERYAKVEVNVSEPIVPFRETVVIPPKLDMVNENIQDQGEEVRDDNEIIQASTADRQCHLKLRAVPLPGQVAEILLEHQQALKDLDTLTAATTTGRSDLQVGYCLAETASETFGNIKQKLKEEFDKAGPEWSGAEEKIWSFGPRRCGPNILMNCVTGYNRPSVWQSFEKNGSDSCRVADLDNSIVTGFQMATLAGPLCEEPMHGVCFVVEDWWYGDRVKLLPQNTKLVISGTDTSKCISSEDVGSKDICDLLTEDFQTKTSLSNTCADSGSDNIQDRLKSSGFVLGFESFQVQKSTYGPISGQLISTMKEGCRQAFQAKPQRLMAAMYRCETQATVEVLGKLHGVLAKRCGQVLSEEMQEGTATFIIIAVLPVVESFGFAEDIRKKTSGLASPQLKFSHWEVVPVDPFWVPTTEEEYMHFGEKADADNKARVYMNQVRKRKGLHRDEKIVEFAEKQRTLTKNK